MCQVNETHFLCQLINSMNQWELTLTDKTEPYSVDCVKFPLDETIFISSEGLQILAFVC